MSRENVEVVRQPIRISDGPHRRLEERIAVRFPNLAVAVMRVLPAPRAGRA